jgi:hypothetical protein
MRPAEQKMSLTSMPPERHYGHAVLMVIERPEGGYERKELWDPEGREWIREEEISTPKHWYQKEPHEFKTLPLAPQ